MANGQQLAEQNFIVFSAWLQSKTDEEFRQFVSRGVLSRKEIAIECGFSKSVLDQNPRIKSSLLAIEDALRERGILPSLAQKTLEQTDTPPTREIGKQRQGLEAERMRRLEQENASLRAENGELKLQLEKYAIMREALSLTGRSLR